MVALCLHQRLPTLHNVILCLSYRNLNVVDHLPLHNHQHRHILHKLHALIDALSVEYFTCVINY